MTQKVFESLWVFFKVSGLIFFGCTSAHYGSVGYKQAVIYLTLPETIEKTNTYLDNLISVKQIYFANLL